LGRPQSIHPRSLVLPIGIDLGPSEAVLPGLGVVLVVALTISPRSWPRGFASLSGMVVVLIVILAAFLAGPGHNE
jgi:hypothetical protein